MRKIKKVIKKSVEKHKFILMNNIEIDKKISKLIQTLWNDGIETIQCCQGGDKVEKETRFTHIENGKIIENTHIIFLKKDLDKIKKFLPINTDYIVGDKSKIGQFEEWLGVFDGVWANFMLKHNNQ